MELDIGHRRLVDSINRNDMVSAQWVRFLGVANHYIWSFISQPTTRYLNTVVKWSDTTSPDFDGRARDPINGKSDFGPKTRKGIFYQECIRPPAASGCDGRGPLARTLGRHAAPHAGRLPARFRSAGRCRPAGRLHLWIPLSSRWCSTFSFFFIPLSPYLVVCILQ